MSAASSLSGTSRVPSTSRMPSTSTAAPPSAEPAPAPTSFFLRLLWMLVGPGIAAVALAVIAFERLHFPSTLDLVVAAAAVGIVGARGLDIARYGGQTATGDPATWSHWRRHSTQVVVVIAAASIAVHALGGP